MVVGNTDYFTMNLLALGPQISWHSSYSLHFAPDGNRSFVFFLPDDGQSLCFCACKHNLSGSFVWLQTSMLLVKKSMKFFLLVLELKLLYIF